MVVEMAMTITMKMAMAGMVVARTTMKAETAMGKARSMAIMTEMEVMIVITAIMILTAEMEAPIASREMAKVKRSLLRRKGQGERMVTVIPKGVIQLQAHQTMMDVSGGEGPRVRHQPLARKQNRNLHPIPRIALEVLAIALRTPRMETILTNQKTRRTLEGPRSSIEETRFLWQRPAMFLRIQDTRLHL